MLLNKRFILHTHIRLTAIFSRTTRVGRYQKGTTNLDLLKQETVSGSGISWAYASLHLAPDRKRCQHPATQFFTSRMPFLPPNQQHQSTEGTNDLYYILKRSVMQQNQEFSKEEHVSSSPMFH